MQAPFQIYGDENEILKPNAAEPFQIYCDDDNNMKEDKIDAPFQIFCDENTQKENFVNENPISHKRAPLQDRKSLAPLSEKVPSRIEERNNDQVQRKETNVFVFVDF